MILELEIEKLSLGGDGIARKDGLVYFVPSAAPGDLVSVKITDKKKNFARAEIVEVLRAGPNRQKAPCPVFGRCGGCNWQHISYEEQLKQKNLIVREQLRKVVSDETEFFDILPSPKPFEYRNRIQLKYDGKNLGFYARNSHQIVTFDKCWISDPALNAKIQELRKTLGSVANPRVELFLDESRKVHQSSEVADDESFGFSQVNTEQNVQLINTVINWSKDFNPPRILDLYAGAGNFSFPFHSAFPNAAVVAAELSPASVRRAQKMIMDKNIPQKKLQFHLTDVAEFLRKTRVQTYDFVFLDPPRIGCSEEVIDTLAKQRPAHVFYISCNPSALARDIARMQKLAPWKIIRVQPFDMFPQTDHIEVLIELKIDSP